MLKTLKKKRDQLLVVLLIVALYGCCGTASQIRFPYDSHMFGHTVYTGDYIQVKKKSGGTIHKHPQQTLVYLDFIINNSQYYGIVNPPAEGDKEEKENQNLLTQSVTAGKLGTGSIRNGYESTDVTFTARRQEILAKVEELFNGIDISFTLTHPAKQTSPVFNFITVRIAPNSDDFFGQGVRSNTHIQSYAPWDPGDNYRNEVVMVWSQTLTPTGAIANEIAHALGHTFGLEDTASNGYIMSHATRGNEWSVIPSKRIDAFELYGRTNQNSCAGKVLKDSLEYYQTDYEVLIQTLGRRKILNELSVKDVEMISSQVCLEGISDYVPPRRVDPDRYDFNEEGQVVVKNALTLINPQAWPPGSIINVGYENSLMPPFDVHNNIVKYSKIWEKYANVTFNFVNDVNDAVIIIGFDSQQPSYSVMGRQALLNEGPLNLKSMNFSATMDDRHTDKSYVRSTILHEFGHALGFGHEHQSPASGIEWNRDLVYDYYFKSAKMSRESVDINIIQKYNKSQTSYSTYDPLSVMHYSFPATLTLNGITGKRNTNLSATDIRYAALWYPFPTSKSTVIRTGDDCDEIQFSTHPNLNIANDEVVFNVFLDEDEVTWWKSIIIPLKNGREKVIEIERGKYGMHSVKVKITDLDFDRPFGFQKAKFLGAHTRLNFTWPAMKVVEGRMSVQFKWVKDHC